MLATLIVLPASAHAAFYYPPAPTWQQAIKPAPSTKAPAPTQDTHNKAGLVSPTYVPPGVTATGQYVTPLPPGSKSSTATYNLDWTIGTAGKSGCMVCHGDKNLIRVIDGKQVSLWLDATVLETSAHKNLLCTDCHLDFAYKTPHPNATATEDWKFVAKSSCKNCHRAQFLDWGQSSHSTAGRPGDTQTVGAADSSAPGKPRPLCGDCHFGHSIPSKDDTAAMAAIRKSGFTMCAGCHEAWSNSYNDYYHGAAYRRGALDAPACWQCHNTHLILPTSDRNAWTNETNLPTTCGQCHKAASEGYLDYAKFVHGRQHVTSSNPLISFLTTARDVVGSAFDQIGLIFRRSGS